jgi:hypothetical protein
MRSRRDIAPQIAPSRIFFLDHRQLPAPIPFLELPLSQQSLSSTLVHFVPDQCLHTMLLGEPGDQVVSMLPNTANEIVC